jgi:K+-transporting ATPase ATPase B chain
MPAKRHSLFDREIIGEAAIASLKKLNPATLLKNPVIFVTEVGAAVTTVALFYGPKTESFAFGLQIALWLWFTVLFANFAEAMAEGHRRGRSARPAHRPWPTVSVLMARLKRCPPTGWNGTSFLLLRRER